MKHNDALALDRLDRLIEAASAYEAILEQEPRLYEMLNLAVMYWDATDFGTLTAYRLSQEFVDHALLRSAALFDQAVEAWPDRPEPLFWRAYTRSIDFDNVFPIEVFECYMVSTPQYLEPEIAIFKAGDAEHLRRAEALIAYCNEEHTFRARYVMSVMESLIRQSTRF